MLFRLFAILCVLLAGAPLVVHAQTTSGEVLPSVSPVLDQPAPLDQRWSAGEVLGSRRGYFHPFLSVGGYFTDNLFNEPSNRRSDWVTVVSPGLWIAVPAARQPLLEINTLNASPGGLELSRFMTAGERRFQGYGLYRADVRRNARFSEEDTDRHRGEGMLRVNFRGGLSLEVLNIYEVNYDSFGTGISLREQDRYTSNLFQFSTVYRVSPKLEGQVDYNFFTLDYDDRVEYRERDDHSIAASLFYRFLPKTSAVLRYEFTDIAYQQPILVDSREHRFLGGFQWEPTARSRSRLLFGYGKKNFAREFTSRDDFISEVQFDLRFTPRSTGYLRAIRRSNQTDIEGTRDVLSHRIQLGYAQQLATRLSGSADLAFVRDSYRGELTFAGLIGERRDNYYSASLTLGYAFREWLNLSCGYSFVERDSNFNVFDYRNNTVFLTLTAAM